jgi:hypothetical protein
MNKLYGLLHRIDIRILDPLETVKTSSFGKLSRAIADDRVKFIDKTTGQSVPYYEPTHCSLEQLVIYEKLIGSLDIKGSINHQCFSHRVVCDAKWNEMYQESIKNIEVDVPSLQPGV